MEHLTLKVRHKPTGNTELIPDYLWPDLSKDADLELVMPPIHSGTKATVKTIRPAEPKKIETVRQKTVEKVVKTGKEKIVEKGTKKRGKHKK